MEWSKCSGRLTSNEFISNVFEGGVGCGFFSSFHSRQLISGTHCCMIPLWVRNNMILGRIRHLRE